MLRGVKKIVKGQKTQDGAGVHLVRVISRPDVVDFDPFLMLDAFDSYNPEDYIKGFPWHPHRGIETVTYLIQGDIEHGDSLGNKGSILALEDGLRFLLFAGKPIKEPIAWGGPIVMNTREELNQAFQDLEDGNFIRKDVIL